MKFIIKVFFSILLIFNLTFVNSAQANPEFVATKSVGTAHATTGHKTQDVVFNSNGTRMFVLNNKSSPQNNNEDKVNQYNIDIADAFDLTEAGSIQAFERVNNRDHAPRSLAFNNDGTKMFVVGDQGNDVNV